MSSSLESAAQRTSSRGTPNLGSGMLGLALTIVVLAGAAMVMRKLRRLLE